MQCEKRTKKQKEAEFGPFKKERNVSLSGNGCGSVAEVCGSNPVIDKKKFQNIFSVTCLKA